jgi:enamine deaminase RidA (YjgF/YER057c/UK114 family)
MEKRQVKPWTWQERSGFSQAWRVDGAQGLVVLAGQGLVSAGGELIGAGDFDAQARQTFENIRTVLEQAGASMDAVVKLTVYSAISARCAASAPCARSSCRGRRRPGRPSRWARSPCPGG